MSLAKKLLEMYENLKVNQLWVTEEKDPTISYHTNKDEKGPEIIVGVNLGMGHREKDKDDDSILTPITFFYSVSRLNGYILGQVGDSFDDFPWHELPKQEATDPVKKKEKSLIKMAQRTLKTVRKK